MKIWVIGRNYPNKENNRQGSFELEQAKMLAKRGNEVVYIYCRLHLPLMLKEKNGNFAFQDDNVAVRGCARYFTPHLATSVIPVPYFPKIRNKIMENLMKTVEKEFGLPDVIHIHYPTVAMSAEVFSAYHDKGVKVVVTEHWTKVLKKQLDAYEINQLRAYLGFVDTFMCVGPPLRRSIQEVTGLKRDILIMPNIVNDVFYPANKKKKYFFLAL